MLHLEYNIKDLKKIKMEKITIDVYISKTNFEYKYFYLKTWEELLYIINKKNSIKILDL